jgi:hypothetical protein
MSFIHFTSPFFDTENTICWMRAHMSWEIVKWRRNAFIQNTVWRTIHCWNLIIRTCLRCATHCQHKVEFVLLNEHISQYLNRNEMYNFVRQNGIYATMKMPTYVQYYYKSFIFNVFIMCSKLLCKTLQLYLHSTKDCLEGVEGEL